MKTEDIPEFQDDEKTVVETVKRTVSSFTPVSEGVLERQKIIRLLDGRYRVDDQIGKGGMGTVYKAYDLELKRTVAIKTILADKSYRLQWLRRFKMEAVIVATLRHPHIVQVHEVVAKGRFPLIIMEYVDGSRFDTIIQSEKVTQRQLIYYFIAICEAMGYAHGRGILHRDIKPSNIMITKDGQPKIMDFGVAKILDTGDSNPAESLQTMEGTLLGSPAFMSPEQARGDHQSLDIRSDVYSLGAAFYFALTKRVPFRGGSFTDVIAKVLREELPAPSKFQRGIAPDLEGICLKAMEKERESRYQNAFEFAKDLSCFRGGLPVSARRYGFKEKVLRAIRRKKETFFFSICAVVIMFSGICFTLSYINRISHESLIRELRGKVMGIAATSALLIDPNLVEAIKSHKDIDKPTCKELVKILKSVKNSNDKIEFVWIMRRSQKRAGYSEFVAEDSYHDSFDELDDNKNGILDPGEQANEIGTIFEDSLEYPDLELGYQRPAADRDVAKTDYWGVSLSGYAPILNGIGESIAILGVDMKSEKVSETFARLQRAYRGALGLSLALSVTLIFLVILWIVGLWEQKRASA